MKPKLLEIILNNDKLKNEIYNYCDVKFQDMHFEFKQYGLKEIKDAIFLAQDSTGGIYILIKQEEIETSPIFYISSEGEAGPVATDFKKFLKIIFSAPYWLDILKFSNNGQLNEMQKAEKILEIDIQKELENQGKNKEKIEKAMYSATKIKIKEEPAFLLFEALNSLNNIIILDEFDEKLEPLMKKYKVIDNPMWKNLNISE